jgi:hypothetical protein
METPGTTRVPSAGAELNVTDASLHGAFTRYTSKVPPVVKPVTKRLNVPLFNWLEVTPDGREDKSN